MNLRFMLIFNPLFVNFYGIAYFDKIHYFKVIIFGERVVETLWDNLLAKDEVKKYKNLKDTNIIEEKLMAVYYLTYSVTTSYALHLPIYYLNLQTILVTKSNQKKLLIPFFIEKFDDPLSYRLYISSQPNFHPA